jgi:hypothetical protein
MPCRESCSWSFWLHKTISLTQFYFSVCAPTYAYKNCHLNHFHVFLSRLQMWTQSMKNTHGGRVSGTSVRTSGYSVKWSRWRGRGRLQSGKVEWMRYITRRCVREAGLTIRGSGLAESWLTVSGTGCDGKDTEWEFWLRDCFIIKMVVKIYTRMNSLLCYKRGRGTSVR